MGPCTVPTSSLRSGMVGMSCVVQQHSGVGSTGAPGAGAPMRSEVICRSHGLTYNPVHMAKQSTLFAFCVQELLVAHEW